MQLHKAKPYILHMSINCGVSTNCKITMQTSREGLQLTMKSDKLLGTIMSLNFSNALSIFLCAENMLAAVSTSSLSSAYTQDVLLQPTNSNCSNISATANANLSSPQFAQANFACKCGML